MFISSLAALRSPLNKSSRCVLGFVSLCAVFILNLCSFTPAKAYWTTPTYKVTGQKEIFLSGVWSMSETWNGTILPDPNQPGGSNYTCGTSSGGYQTKATLQIEATLEWRGGGYQPVPAPAVAWIKVTSNADAYGVGTNAVDNGSGGLTPKFIQSGNANQDGSYLVAVPVVNNKAVFTKTISASAVGAGSYGINLQYSVTSISASLSGDSTANTAGWDSAQPRFFSGTNCKAQGTAVAAVGSVSHAQLLINGTIVREYWNSTIAPPAYSLAGYVSVGTNQTSVPLNVAFDSTHFNDGSPIVIKMFVEDTSANIYTGQISANAYNKAQALANSTFVNDMGMPSIVAGNMINYTCPTSTSLYKNDILQLLPSLTALYIDTHGNTGTIGDCYVTRNSPLSSYLCADSDPSGGISISTRNSQKTLDQPPMNFVFTDACLTAHSSELANAFGSVGTDRAFLGWANSEAANEASRRWTTNLMQNLRSGNTLRDAVIDATANGPADGLADGVYNPDPNAPEPPLNGTPGIPFIYGDSSMTLHGVYGAQPTFGWIRPY